MSTPQLTRDEAIRAAIVAQVTELIEANYAKVVKAAQESFRQDDEAGEIEAKIAFAVSFFPAVQSPAVKVKASWSVKYSDESETIVDCEQTKLPFESIRREGISVELCTGDTVAKLGPLPTTETSADFLKRAAKFDKEASK